jgi:amidohydrolase
MAVKKLMDDRMFKRLVTLRRRIHSYPEPAYHEHRTAAAITKYLDRLKIPYRSGVAETGVVARLGGIDPSGPTIALRADMDALPVDEKTGLPYASKVKGFMHACGHDGHVAIVMGAAELLKKNPPAGNVVFLFQPAEEGEGGALRMIEEGALDGVDMIFGGHIEGAFHVGEIGARRDVDSSYTDALEIRIVGKGGHAARPHETVDAVLVSSLFVLGLQNIVSRSINPLNPTVITIGSIHAGTVYNVVADEALLQGTVRNTDKATREDVIRRIKKTAQALGELHDARIEVNILEGYPPVINHRNCFRIARSTAQSLLGEDKFMLLAKPSMGGEDFSYYLERVPGCFVRIGGLGKDVDVLTAHSSHFNFDEEVIRVGAIYFDRLVRDAIAAIKADRG